MDIKRYIPTYVLSNGEKQNMTIKCIMLKNNNIQDGYALKYVKEQ